jgi:hypothetical protein
MGELALILRQAALAVLTSNLPTNGLITYKRIDGENRFLTGFRRLDALG